MSKRKKNINKIYCADFETTSLYQYKKENETRVYLYKIVSLDNKVSDIGINIKQFFKFINSLDSNSTIYFHNLSFDGEFILWELMRQGYKDIGDDELPKFRSKYFKSIITDTSSIFMISFINDNEKLIEFRCSYKVFPNSIKNIGKFVGLEKLDETHDYEEIKNYKSIDEITNEELSYINNDVEILRRLIQYLESINMLNISMSTNAYKSWKKDKYFFAKDCLIKTNDDIINNYIDKSYKGGITTISKRYKGILLNECISFDVNSLYPSVMYENSMPYGEGHYFKDYSKCHYPKKIICIYVEEVNIIEGMQPFIPCSSGFSFDVSYSYNECIKEKFLYLWEDEFKLFKDWYIGSYLIVGCVGFKARNNVFNKYIDYWIDVKMKSPNDSPERQFAKLQLNSLYGKFGMNDCRYSKKAVCIKGSEIIYKTDETHTFYYYRPIASYITSMARCKLVRAIALLQDRFIYCDTDSIYLKGYEIPTCIPIDDKKLGYWKFEHYYNHFKGLKAKCYLKDYTDKNGNIVYESSIAGLPKECRGSITYENFKNGLELKGVKKCKCKVKGGIVIGRTDFKIHCKDEKQ